VKPLRLAEPSVANHRSRYNVSRGAGVAREQARGTAYRCGDCRNWKKVKTAAWREANRERWRKFERA
jgi:hypothetical protein